MLCLIPDLASCNNHCESKLLALDEVIKAVAMFGEQGVLSGTSLRGWEVIQALGQILGNLDDCRFSRVLDDGLKA